MIQTTELITDTRPIKVDELASLDQAVRSARSRLGYYLKMREEAQQDIDKMEEELPHLEQQLDDAIRQFVEEHKQS